MIFDDYKFSYAFLIMRKRLLKPEFYFEFLIGPGAQRKCRKGQFSKDVKNVSELRFLGIKTFASMPRTQQYVHWNFLKVVWVFKTQFEMPILTSRGKMVILH